MTTKCLFNECANVAELGSNKCYAHRNRSKCIELGCLNQAYALNRCIRHGAKKRCIIEACQQSRRLGPYCSKHAQNSKKKRCQIAGCEKQPHAKGKCVRHGGGRFCKFQGCSFHARIGPYCARHGGKTTQLEPSLQFLEPVNLGDLNAQSLGEPDALDWAILTDLTMDIKWEIDDTSFGDCSFPSDLKVERFGLPSWSKNIYLPLCETY
ncbi:unnamed protein product [Aphanomyces euteiches]|uniref:Uncharacterized protein n=1 Tax=Aphanomyces euteiches TaxID=100861 RepID=A0A6G0XE67_9STRA|nr:hypothetical protein Ae201684_005684 [Aphanomyces euteiches]KAH9078595.1 hypothetical protein Ae201684P_019675 [Aphanomyces euteiches]KAH9145435.1 hypothetical protein AeRB84_010661 [Aphanomyces euteiches]